MQRIKSEGDYDAARSLLEVRRRDGRTYNVVTDAEAFRAGVARLLAEVQRIKSEGDYDAARSLFETDDDMRITASGSIRRCATRCWSGSRASIYRTPTPAS